MDRPLAHRALVECPAVTEILMYHQSRLSESIRLTRADPGSTVVDCLPRHGDWTRLFSEVVGSEGRAFSFVPTEIAEHRTDPDQGRNGGRRILMQPAA